MISQKLNTEAGWDDYWKRSEGGRPTLYSRIASIYRDFLIRPALNRASAHLFSGSSRLLHAGCGAGQTDLNMSARYRITALDISEKALTAYRKLNPVAEVVRGDIFSIPLETGAYDGVYNLGVMEHFTEEEIVRILKEFSRVLKPDGRILLFWPPEHGLSVLFLKAVHFCLNRVLRKDIQLHPEEISRLRSRAHAEQLLRRAGFKLIRYSFGPSDLFTYAVLTAIKDHQGGSVQ